MLAIPVVIAKFPSTGYERASRRGLGRNDDVDVEGLSRVDLGPATCTCTRGIQMNFALGYLAGAHPRFYLLVF